MHGMHALDAIGRFGKIVAVAGRSVMTYNNIKAQDLQVQVIHTDHFMKKDA